MATAWMAVLVVAIAIPTLTLIPPFGGTSRKKERRR